MYLNPPATDLPSLLWLLFFFSHLSKSRTTQYNKELKVSPFKLFAGSCFQPRPVRGKIMTGEDAADASSVTEKCSPEREEREQEEQAEGKLKPQIRPLNGREANPPCVAATRFYCGCVEGDGRRVLPLRREDFHRGRTARDFTKTRDTHHERRVCCECMTGSAAR